MHVCPFSFESLITEDEKEADEGNLNYKAHNYDKKDTQSNDNDNNIEYRNESLDVMKCCNNS